MPKAADDPASPESLKQKEAALAALAALPTTARPVVTSGALPLEDYDPELAAARKLLASAGTAEHYRRVAEAYARLRVFDAAYDHFSAALRLNGKDAAAYDGRARVWRDWGLPGRGLSDAYRAVYLAPNSPAPRNTLGTLFVRLGLFDQARAAFAKALEIDPNAAYAIENLCRTAKTSNQYSAAIAGRCASRQ